jgi:GT2 family glycosyltransferase
MMGGDTSPPLVTAIIVNWNGKEHTRRCLDSLADQDYRKNAMELVVVDNGSSDGSQVEIEGWFDEHRQYGFHRLLFIRNGSNLGAPAAINSAVRQSDPRSSFIWKLDNDVIVPTDVLRKLVAAFKDETSLRLGAVTCQYMNAYSGAEEPIGSTLCRGLQRWTKVLRPVTYSEWRKHDDELVMLSGGCCLFPRTVFEQVGLFEERFFLYYDDSEFCMRLYKNGYRFSAAPDACVIHCGSASTGAVPGKRMYFWVRNLLLLGHRYFDGVERAIFHAVQVVIFPWRLARIIQLQHGVDLRTTIRMVVAGYADFYRGRWRAIQEL